MLKIYLNFQPKQFRGKTSLDWDVAQQSLWDRDLCLLQSLRTIYNFYNIFKSSFHD